MTPLDIRSRIEGAQGITPGLAGKAAPHAQKPGSPSFGDVLQGQMGAGDIKFSGHARTRLQSRQIELTQEDLLNLGAAITKAAAKGARESLVIMDKAALVVSVPNRTVITAVGRGELKDNIFTNIDSALLL